MLYQKSELIQAAKWARGYIDSLPDDAFLVVEADYAEGKTTDKRARHLPVKDESGNLILDHYDEARARIGRIVPVSGSESIDQLRTKAGVALEKLTVQAEELRKKTPSAGGGKQKPLPKHSPGHPHRAGSAKAVEHKPDAAGGIRTMTEEEIRALQKERDDLKDQVAALDAKVLEFEDADHAKTLSARDARIEELEAKVVELEAEKVEATKAKEEAETKAETLTATNVELASKNEKLSGKIDEAEKVEAEAKVAERKAQIEAMEKLSPEFKEKCIARATDATDEDWAFIVEGAELVNGGKGKQKEESPLKAASREAGGTPAGEVPDGAASDNKLTEFHRALKKKRAEK